MRLALLLIFGIIALNAARADGIAQTPSRPAVPACHSPQQPKNVAELIFGRDIGARLGVSESGWSRFVAREITPRFPDGLTTTDAVGQWRDRLTGNIVREPSKQVEIVLPGNGDDQARLDAIVDAYKRDFHQQGVAVIVRPACVSF